MYAACRKIYLMFIINRLPYYRQINYNQTRHETVSYVYSFYADIITLLPIVKISTDRGISVYLHF